MYSRLSGVEEVDEAGDGGTNQIKAEHDTDSCLRSTSGAYGNLLSLEE